MHKIFLASLVILSNTTSAKLQDSDLIKPVENERLLQYMARLRQCQINESQECGNQLVKEIAEDESLSDNQLSQLICRFEIERQIALGDTAPEIEDVKTVKHCVNKFDRRDKQRRCMATRRKMSQLLSATRLEEFRLEYDRIKKILESEG